jgi:hypothetical protein
MLESSIQSKIMLDLGSRPDVRLFRNNVGNGFHGQVFEESPRCVTLINYRRVQYGLCVGSGDLIGFKSVVITPEMVGRRVAIFVSSETKRPKENPKPAQDNWRIMVGNLGGFSGVVRSVEDAQTLVGPPGALP